MPVAIAQQTLLAGQLVESWHSQSVAPLSGTSEEQSLAQTEAPPPAAGSQQCWPAAHVCAVPPSVALNGQ
jgi:hypothetical protein